MSNLSLNGKYYIESKCPNWCLDLKCKWECSLVDSYNWDYLCWKNNIWKICIICFRSDCDRTCYKKLILSKFTKEEIKINEIKKTLLDFLQRINLDDINSDILIEIWKVIIAIWIVIDLIEHPSYNSHRIVYLWEIEFKKRILGEIDINILISNQKRSIVHIITTLIDLIDLRDGKKIIETWRKIFFYWKELKELELMLNLADAECRELFGRLQRKKQI